RERVLLAHVVRAHEDAALRYGYLCTMPEPRFRSDAIVRAHRVPTELPERHDDAHVAQQRQLLLEERTARVSFRRRRLVLWWRAFDRGGDEATGEAKAVVAALAGRLVRKAGAVQRREEEVTRAVAGEDSSRAVAPVCRRCESDDEQPCVRIAEPRHR